MKVVRLGDISSDPAHRTVGQVCIDARRIAKRECYTHAVVILYKHEMGGTDHACMLAGDTKRLELLGLLTRIQHSFLEDE